MDSVEAIQALVRDNRHIHISGNGTKTGLSGSSTGATSISLSGLSGIIEYEPAEYTFTAYAGTPVSVIQRALSDHQQYLPCDPLLVQDGATLGGTIASNTSGSRRYRYGGLRDFILGMKVIDGQGRYFRCGGKVVKNSAGFDLPKFFVGSMGQYGIMSEVTFKVFPEPPVFASLRLMYATLDDLLNAIFYLNQQPFELDALDIEPLEKQWCLLARFGGSEGILPDRLARFVRAMQANTAMLSSEAVEDDASTWAEINHLTTLKSRTNAVKILLSPRQIPALDAEISGTTHRYSVGGNIAWVGTDDIVALDTILTQQNLTGLTLLGNTYSSVIGKPIDNIFAQRVKAVLDPENKFV